MKSWLVVGVIAMHATNAQDAPGCRVLVAQATLVESLVAKASDPELIERWVAEVRRVDQATCSTRDREDLVAALSRLLEAWPAERDRDSDRKAKFLRDGALVLDGFGRKEQAEGWRRDSLTRRPDPPSARAAARLLPKLREAFPTQNGQVEDDSLEPALLDAKGDLILPFLRRMLTWIGSLEPNSIRSQQRDIEDVIGKLTEGRKDVNLGDVLTTTNVAVTKDRSWPRSAALLDIGDARVKAISRLEDGGLAPVQVFRPDDRASRQCWFLGLPGSLHVLELEVTTPTEDRRLLWVLQEAADEATAPSQPRPSALRRRTVDIVLPRTILADYLLVMPTRDAARDLWLATMATSLQDIAKKANVSYTGDRSTAVGQVLSLLLKEVPDAATPRDRAIAALRGTLLSDEQARAVVRWLENGGDSFGLLDPRTATMIERLFSLAPLSAIPAGTRICRPTLAQEPQTGAARWVLLDAYEDVR